MNNFNLSLEDAIDGILLMPTSLQCMLLLREVESFFNFNPNTSEAIVLVPVHQQLERIAGFSESATRSDRVAFAQQCTWPDDIMPRHSITLSKRQVRALHSAIVRLYSSEAMESFLDDLAAEICSKRSRSVVFSPFPPVEETAIDPLWCHVVNPHSTP